jgi:pimeloyl-ACP methyl ester carboxylesterase
MIMGSGSTRDLWPPEVLCSLSSEYKVVIFDNRGMGYTTAPPGNFSIVQFPEERLKGHPGFYKQFPVPKETSTPENIARQNEAIERWPGTYDRLSI